NTASVNPVVFGSSFTIAGVLEVFHDSVLNLGAGGGAAGVTLTTSGNVLVDNATGGTVVGVLHTKGGTLNQTGPPTVTIPRTVNVNDNGTTTAGTATFVGAPALSGTMDVTDGAGGHPGTVNMNRAGQPLTGAGNLTVGAGTVTIGGNETAVDLATVGTGFS